MRNVAIFVCVCLGFAACAPIVSQFSIATKTGEYKQITKEWTRCAHDRAFAYEKAELDLRVVVDAAVGGCGKYRNDLELYLLQHHVRPSLARGLAGDLEKILHDSILDALLARRAGKHRTSQQRDYATAQERRWRPLAEQGDAKAQFTLGIMYYEGEGVPQDKAKATKWYRRAAEQGHALAQLMLGHIFGFGEGAPQDKAEAVKWYRLAAEQRVVDAQYALGVAYFGGRGVVQDNANAVKWFRLAAEQGNAHAQNDLGLMYGMGWGVPKDAVKAVNLYRNAAEQGNAHAQYRLASHYRSGKGVSQDYVQAYMWFNIAALRFPPGEWRDASKTRRDKLSKQMTPNQIAEAQRLAREWKPKKEGK